MNRKCGDCKVCCIETSIIEANFEKPRFTPCKFLCDKGCSIYEDRFNTCKEYDCYWLEGHGDDEDRPDKSGLIVDIKEFGGVEYVTVREVRPNAFNFEFIKRIRTNSPVLVCMFDDTSKVTLPQFIVEDNELKPFDCPPIIKNWDFPDNVSHKTKDEVLYHWLLGISYVKMNERIKAIASLKKAVEILPDFKPGKDVLSAINS